MSSASSAISGGPVGADRRVEIAPRTRRTSETRRSMGRVTHRRISHAATSVPTRRRTMKRTTRNVSSRRVVAARSSDVTPTAATRRSRASRSARTRSKSVVAAHRSRSTRRAAAPITASDEARSPALPPASRHRSAEATTRSSGTPISLDVGRNRTQRTNETTRLAAAIGIRREQVIGPLMTKPRSPVSWSA